MLQSITNNLVKTIIKLLLLLSLIIASIIVVRGYLFVNNELKLESWHLESSLKEPSYQDYSSFEEYKKAEKIFLDNSYNLIELKEKKHFNRYYYSSRSSPYIENREVNDLGEKIPAELRGINVNESFKLVPKGKILGGVLLLHGLTDSPYSQRDIAKIFLEKGYIVLSLRYPYHGTQPGEMLKIKYEDWKNVTEYGLKLLKDELKEIEKPEIILSGYSTGGPISLNYILEQVKNKGELPSKVFWFSPAMGVTPYAKIGFLDIALSKIPYFDKFKWLEIEPEFDGGKYNSFTKNAGIEVSKLISKNNKLLNKLTKEEKEKLPPIYIYQSLVDATVNDRSIYKVNEIIGNTKGEIIIFDVNRKFNDFFTTSIQNKTMMSIIEEYSIKTPVTLLSNIEKNETDEIEIYKYSDGNITKEQPTTPIMWKEFSVSLAHISLPISPDNYHYGKNTILGNINLKGEKEILTVSYDDISRLRYNQFFDYLKENVRKNLNSSSNITQ
ncbi:MAG: alpha/beta hydrolase [Fusobacteriaceae bacterium]